MGVIFVPFRVQHAAELHAAHPAAVPHVPRDLARSLEVPGLSWSAYRDERLIGCGGIAPETAWRGIGWALVAPGVDRRAWSVITRRARDVLAAAHVAGMHRIACYVDIRFGHGMIWARKLGFEPDGIARAWQPDRTDAVIYSRVG